MWSSLMSKILIMASSDSGSSLYSPPSLPLENIAEPQETDVLCGRGKHPHNRVGNRMYRHLISSNQAHYAIASAEEKPLISTSIFQTIRLVGGRFLAKDPNSDTYVDIGYQKAKEKISQALREGQSKLRENFESGIREVDNYRRCVGNDHGNNGAFASMSFASDLTGRSSNITTDSASPTTMTSDLNCFASNMTPIVSNVKYKARGFDNSQDLKFTSGGSNNMGAKMYAVSLQDQSTLSDSNDSNRDDNCQRSPSADTTVVAANIANTINSTRPPSSFIFSPKQGSNDSLARADEEKHRLSIDTARRMNVLDYRTSSGTIQEDEVVKDDSHATSRSNSNTPRRPGYAKQSKFCNKRPTSESAHSRGSLSTLGASSIGGASFVSTFSFGTIFTTQEEEEQVEEYSESSHDMKSKQKNGMMQRPQDLQRLSQSQDSISLEEFFRCVPIGDEDKKKDHDYDVHDAEVNDDSDQSDSIHCAGSQDDIDFEKIEPISLRDLEEADEDLFFHGLGHQHIQKLQQICYQMQQQQLCYQIQLQVQQEDCMSSFEDYIADIEIDSAKMEKGAVQPDCTNASDRHCGDDSNTPVTPSDFPPALMMNPRALSHESRTSILSSITMTSITSLAGTSINTGLFESNYSINNIESNGVNCGTTVVIVMHHQQPNRSALRDLTRKMSAESEKTISSTETSKVMSDPNVTNSDALLDDLTSGSEIESLQSGFSSPPLSVLANTRMLEDICTFDGQGNLLETATVPSNEDDATSGSVSTWILGRGGGFNELDDIMWMSTKSMLSQLSKGIVGAGKGGLSKMLAQSKKEDGAKRAQSMGAISKGIDGSGKSGLSKIIAQTIKGGSAKRAQSMGTISETLGSLSEQSLLSDFTSGWSLNTDDVASLGDSNSDVMRQSASSQTEGVSERSHVNGGGFRDELRDLATIQGSTSKLEANVG